MQLGIGTYTYGWAVGIPGNMPLKPMSALDLLEKVKEFGLRHVQIGDNLPLHTMSNGELQVLIDFAKKNGITIEIGARGLTPLHLKRYIDLASQMNASLLRFIIDLPGYKPAIDEVIEIIKDHLPLLHEKNITLGIENHDRLLAREFAQIMQAVGDDSVGICLDSVNSMGAGEGIEEIVRTLAPYTVNLHVKDFVVRRLSHLMGFQIDGRPAGEGMLNIPWLLEKTAPFNRCKTAILEQWVIPESILESTIIKEQIWAEESIKYLKPFF